MGSSLVRQAVSHRRDMIRADVLPEPYEKQSRLGLGVEIGF